MRFRIYRYNPEQDKKPYMQDYELQDITPGMMLLDALLLLKEQDPSLGFRRSCREGVCGSDGMNINGTNGLACITPLAGIKQPVEIRPMPRLPVIRDLIVDMEPFNRQYREVKPYLIVKDPLPEAEPSPPPRSEGPEALARSTFDALQRFYASSALHTVSVMSLVTT